MFPVLIKSFALQDLLLPHIHAPFVHIISLEEGNPLKVRESVGGKWEIVG